MGTLAALHNGCEGAYNEHLYLDIAKFWVEKSPIQTDISIQNYYGNLALHNVLCSSGVLCLLPLTKLLSSCDPNVKTVMEIHHYMWPVDMQEFSV